MNRVNETGRIVAERPKTVKAGVACAGDSLKPEGKKLSMTQARRPKASGHVARGNAPKRGRR